MVNPSKFEKDMKYIAEEYRKTKNFMWIMFGVIMMLTLFVIVAITHANEISEETAVHCILGEARGEYAKNGINSFVAVAEVLRNRASTQGIYGCQAHWNNDEGRYLRANGLIAQAKEAWHLSLASNITKGATYFESTDFKRPNWSKNMQQTLKIGKHVFWKA